MTNADFASIIQDCHHRFQVPTRVIEAVINAESSWDPDAVRYESNWRWLFQVDHFAYDLGITGETERMLQSCSWGLMQVMGSVARENAFSGPLHHLCKPELGIRYGSIVLQKLLNKYNDIYDAVAAYNAGTVIKLRNGEYRNQLYVDRVSRYLRAR